MPEKLLHYIWKYRLFEAQNLRTTQGVLVQIILFGHYNARNAGADFSDARIVLGSDVLVGSVEIHINATDWAAHHHHADAAYNNVILHVVWHCNKPVYRQDGTEIPQIELKNLVNPALIDTYLRLSENENPLPCHSFLSKIPTFTKNTWLERLAIERLENKTHAIAELLKQNNQHWEATFYQTVAKYFGFKTNEAPFLALAQSINIEILAKQMHSPTQIEALFFGQSGLLPTAPTPCVYTTQLQQNYKFLSAKYNLTPLQAHQWKFSRMRPPNFPTVRIAQFAALIQQSSHLFSKIINAKTTDELMGYFAHTPHEYWLTHYTFGEETAQKSKNFGKAATQIMIANVVAPFYYLYAKIRQKPELIDRATEILEQLPPETNHITQLYAPYNFAPQNALQAQAQIELSKNYCTPKRCLECNIGISILKNPPTTPTVN
jgi:hypothetical protein